MQLFGKHKIISSKEADTLLEKYYEGFTSAEEERQLRLFMSQPDLPEQYDADRTILGYFTKEKEAAKPKQKPLVIPVVIRWTSVAAALVGGIFLVKSLLTEQPHCYAYIEGQKVTDINKVKRQAMASLQNVTPDYDEVQHVIKQLDNDDLISSQLAVFAGK